MPCSISTLLAIITLFVAVTLNIISFSLPLWSTSEIVNEAHTNDVVKADFTAGVWGYCTNVQLHDVHELSSSVTFDHCYFYRTSNHYGTSTAAARFFENFVSESICKGYTNTNNRPAFTLALATTAGLDAAQFDRFLGKTCGVLGRTTLAVASLAAASGVLGFVGVVLGVTCCKHKSLFHTIVRLLIVVAFVCNFLTFILWTAQASPLKKKDHVHFSSSFVLNIVSTVLFFGTGVILGRHE